jgi:hypothetical protein
VPEVPEARSDQTNQLKINIERISQEIENFYLKLNNGALAELFYSKFIVAH